MAGLSSINRAFNRVPRRAESRVSTQLKDTFVDSGVAAALESIDHQVVYGRRGTGKTHAFAYLAATRAEAGDIGIYVDLRTVGSAEGLFEFEQITPVERTARILVDLLGQVHDAVLNAVLDDDALVADESFVTKLDTFLTSLTGIRVAGPVESTVEKEDTTSSASSVKAGLTLPQPTVSMTIAAESGGSNRDRQVEVRRGQERISLNFADVARALRELAASLSARRIWLLLDEWSSLPLDVQPYLGAFLVRCVTPVQAFTVKIAAIEQQTRFRHVLEGGTTIGIELGADFAANINLDEFMVFEQDAQRARDFFRGLLFKHLTAGVDDDERVDGLNSESDLISLGFTGYRVFDELVRAAEGVPRDAINIAAKAAFRASDRTISMPDVRAAARQWFQADKEGALRGVPAAHELLNWVIDKVIREKRARGFLVNQRSAGAPLLTALFDARVLHLVRRGYSAQDAPGERYDVYVIDYGAYVDLINTQNAPQGMLPLNEELTDGGSVEVPEQDLRALRRAILDIDTFVQSTSTPG